ncbi:Unconventional myosin-XV [Chamberlinius hualienensis]
MEEFAKGDLVWFDPGVSGVGYILPGEVIEFHRAGQVVTVQAVINSKPQTFTLSNLSTVKRRQDLGENGIEDMIQLTDLNEASLLWNLKIRYDKEFIYTYIGSILVAVNPYKMYDVYGLDVVKKYEGQILGVLSPHLFAIGSSAYSKMSKDGENQVVIISGESGAGKTESTKLIMQYLAAVNKSPSNLITEQILEASPLLESFGNAKTVRNDNSSRFGKYLEVHFKDGVITGAQTTEYLLEKSRIVTQAQDERNYHVFYEMLAGLNKEIKEKYGLQSADKYFYLNQGGSFEIQCKYDSEDFKALLSAMQVLGFTSEEQDTIWKILASVLHLGNVYFHKKNLKHGQEGVEIGSDAEIRWAAHLLQLSVDGIVLALTTKITEARNERVFTSLNIDQALDVRDALAKALYSRLFTWLVQRVNNIIYKGSKKTSIAILDIFGFEDFKENSFEQLCINYANEMLQLHFNKYIFKLEQQEYAKEKIEWQMITFQDNQPVINLISKKPIGILHVLDDESNFPKATDHSFLEKCHYNHALNDLYSRPRMSSMEFGVKHYAGQVWYSVDSFLDKNRDTLRWDVVELLIGSKLELISEMFLDLRSTSEAAKTINKANGRFVTMKPRTPTVAARFNDSLSQLVESMSQCNPWFVRCLKPNNTKTPMKFDIPVVLEQLRYSGMMETIRIRKIGYPVRLKFTQFGQRYRCLVQGRISKGASAREICRIILDQLEASKEDYQLGSNKVFLREMLEQQLEKFRVEVVLKAVVTIQKYVRRRLVRKHYLAMQRSAVIIQTIVRGWLARSQYQRLKNGVIKAQANYRMYHQRKQYLKMKEDIKNKLVAEKLARERAKAKAQKEQEERNLISVAGVNHLEIPAELAFIYSKLDDWQSPHSERNVIKVVGNIPEQPEPLYLPNDIDQHVFTKFTNIYFKNHVWGMKRDPIKTPFLAKSKDADYHESLAVFKLILRFMNDNNLSGKKEMVLGNYIVQKALTNDKLRNEILCQLCNQTWKNDNEANAERGWIMMANCLSCFTPDKTLYKYLLKYVSDYGYDGYKALCQKKLLESEAVVVGPQLERNYPPCLLEWKTNTKRMNMALEALYPDGESAYGVVDSWSTGEEFTARLLKRRGITELNGWTVSLNEVDSMRELNGTDYVLDLISELEAPTAFPLCESYFITSYDKRRRHGFEETIVHQSGHSRNIHSNVEGGGVESPDYSKTYQRESRPLNRISREKILENHRSREDRRSRSLSRDRATSESPPPPNVSKNGGQLAGKSEQQSAAKGHNDLERFGLSKSKLNDRYHSMENLVDRHLQVAKAADDEWKNIGLASSSLNDRYFQQKNSPGNKTQSRNGSSSASSTKSPPLREGRIAEIKKNLRNEFNTDLGVNGHSGGESSESPLSSPDLPRSPEPKLNDNAVDFPEFDFVETIGKSNGRGGDKNSASSGDHHGTASSSSHYVKSKKSSHSTSNSAISHTTKAQIETQYNRHYDSKDSGTRSSALSDTSEAPSLASHVRRVRVPSQASDLDQYLDDLFNPVLEGNLDELSDARSLAASIKGGGNNVKRQGVLNNGTVNVDSYINNLFKPIFMDDTVDDLENMAQLTQAIRGGVDTQPNPVTMQPPGNYPYQMNEMMSPPPMSGMVSPPPPFTAAGSNVPPMFGGGLQTVMSPLGLNSTLPLYNLGVLMDPSQQLALQQQLLQQQFQFNSVPPQMQQMQQRAFLASAVQQNLQLQQQLMQQNQTLQQLLQQQAQSQPVVNMGGAARTSTPLSPEGIDPPIVLNTSYRNSDLLNTSGSKFHVPRFSHDGPDHQHQHKSRHSNNNLNTSQDPDRSWSGSSSPHSGPQQKPFQDRIPPLQDRFSSHGQLQQGNDSGTSAAAWFQPPPPMKMPTNSMAAYNDVISEMKIQSRSNDNMVPTSRGRPPPPPPPLPPNPPEATHPFVDVFGRAKTVRIGKWRWPPRESENGEIIDVKAVNEIDFDARRGSESSGKSGERSLNVSKESITDLQLKQTAGNVGKLKISTEMRAKLEAVTLSHSVRAGVSNKDGRRPPSAANKSKSHNKEDGKMVRKLEENRKQALQMKLGGGRGADFAVQKSIHDVRNVQSFTASPPPPPPPVAPPSFNIPPPIPQSSTYGDASSSYYGQTTSVNPEPKLPPRPISPSAGRFREVPQRVVERFDDDNIHFSRTEMITRSIDEVDRKHLVEDFRTQLFPMSTAPFCTYTRVPWTLHIRKEVFSPSEQLANPLTLHMVFSQVVNDIYWKACIRIPPPERLKMRQLLDNYGVTTSNIHSPHHKVTIKKNIVDIARDWPTYFCRLFPVQGGRQFPDAHYLGVGHSGIHLVQRDLEPTDTLSVLSSFGFEEVMDASCPRASSIQVLMRNGGRITLYSHKCNQIRSMIEQYCIESETGGQEFVRAVADYVTRESTLLSFNRGDIIRVIHRNKYLEKGWLYGEVGGRTGIFPCEYVVPLSRNELAELTKQKPYRRSQPHRSPSPTPIDVNSEQNVSQSHKIASHLSSQQHHHHHYSQQQHLQQDSRINIQNSVNHTSNRHSHHSPTRISSPVHLRALAVDVKKDVNREQSHWTDQNRDFMDDKSEISQMTSPPANDGKHSLLQFALIHFRQSLDKYEMLRTADGSIRGSLKMIESMKAKKKGKKGKDTEWTWREQVDMVKYTKSPIQASLLKLDMPELNKLALECFIAIMRFMGDYPMGNDQTEVECVYAVLINCHRHPPLRDEIYCQIMKQTTNNKSSKSDSCQRGWRLFSILAAYFQCSDLLKPYLIKYLETAAYDKRRAYHGTAMVCLQNLRKTFKYGGRKNVPSIEEVAAISAGRNSKRQIYRLPGGTERVINTKSTSVVHDIIEEICCMLNVRSSQHEMEEFSLYCIVEGDTFTMPLAREEYILDVTTELQRNQQVFYLIFCRSVWYYPMRLDNQLYIEVVFNQIAPDYLEGLLLVMQGGQLKQEHVYDLARVAALLHRAAQMESVPTLKETKYLLPKPVLTIREIKPPQWVNMVQDSWKDAERLTSTEAKAQVLEILQTWPLFGSSFFAVKRIGDKETGDVIMALNRNGVHFLDVITHETLQCYPFSEVISTRKVRAEDGTLFLDMKCGNLMVQKITRIQTDQAHEISRLIRQYITIEQRNRGLVSSEATENPVAR